MRGRWWFHECGHAVEDEAVVAPSEAAGGNVVIGVPRFARNDREFEDDRVFRDDRV
jgi:hypothetical protein